MNNNNIQKDILQQPSAILAKDYLQSLTKALQTGLIKLSVKISDRISTKGNKYTTLSLYFEEFVKPGAQAPFNKENYRSFVNETSFRWQGESLRKIVSQKIEFDPSYGIWWRANNWTDSQLSNHISWAKGNQTLTEQSKESN